MRENPDAEELLAEAAGYFEQRELEYEREIQHDTAAQSRLVLGSDLGQALVPPQAGSHICGVPIDGNGVCTQKVTTSTKKCAAGHTPRR